MIPIASVSHNILFIQPENDSILLFRKHVADAKKNNPDRLRK